MQHKHTSCRSLNALKPRSDCLNKCLRRRVFWPPWIDTLVKGHAHDIKLLNRPVKHALHGSMCTQWFRDASPSAVLCVQFNWFEPANVLWRVEHEANCGTALVHSHRVTCAGEECRAIVRPLQALEVMTTFTIQDQLRMRCRKGSFYTSRFHGILFE